MSKHRPRPVEDLQGTLYVVSPDGHLVTALAPLVEDREALTLSRFESSAAALEEMAGATDVSLLLSEQSLSGGTGIELLRRVRDQHPEVPVVLAGPDIDPREEQAALEAGAADVVRLTTADGAGAVLRTRTVRALRRARSGSRAPNDSATDQRATGQDARSATPIQREALVEVLLAVERAAVDADARAAFTRRVCSELVAVDGIAAAWFGRTDGRDAPIEPSAGADSATDRSGVPDGRIDPSSPRPAAAAVRTGELVVVDDLQSAQHDSLPGFTGRSFGSAISVPLQRAGAPAGVATVYATQSGAFDDVQDLFRALGDTLEYGRRAVTWKQALLADTVTDLEVTLTGATDLFSRVARRTGVQLELDAVVPRDGTDLVFLTLSEGDAAAAEAAFVAQDAVDDVESLSWGDRTLCKLELHLPAFVTDVVAAGGTLRGLTTDGDRTDVDVALPVEVDVRRIVRRLEQTADRGELRSRVQRPRSSATDRRFQFAFEKEVTDRQREALWAAHSSGYFEWPRAHSGQEVADLLGISQPTFNRHLRLALQSVLAVLFDEAGE